MASEGGGEANGVDATQGVAEGNGVSERCGGVEAETGNDNVGGDDGEKKVGGEEGSGTNGSGSSSLFVPRMKRIQRMALYETKSKFYLVGSNNTQTSFR